MLDTAGQAVLAGTARLGENATFGAEIGKLAAGRYTLMAEITVNGNASNADIRHFEFTVP